LRADLWRAILLVLVAGAAAGCAAGRAYSRAERAARAGDWDMAVTYYAQAVQASPQSVEYKIGLERAQMAASRQHLDAAIELESKGDLDGAIREYRKTSEFDPTNSRAATKAIQLQQVLRDKLEASRPKPPVEQMKERARQAGAEPILNPSSREPLRLKFAANTNIQDILTFIGQASGINILYDRDVQNRPSPSAIDLDGVTLEQSLMIVLTTNGLFYKTLNEKTILVIPENTTKRQQYEEQMIRTFYLSNADPAEIQTLLNAIMSGGGVTSRPSVSISKASNTVTVRGSAAVVAIAEQLIENNDKPRAEVVIDVEILEVNRERVKQYGLNLSQYAIGGVFSPEGSPSTSTSSGSTASTSPAASLFNLNTLSHGVNTSDFYLQVPSYTVRFLESDTHNKLIAKPSLRGAEGAKLTLNLGDDIPVPSTTFLPLVAGGVATSPSVSFNYRTVGVIIEATPRVTLDGDIILDLSVESSTRGGDVNISGQNLPSFGSRKVVSRMRLRDGESNLLAGLLRDDERKVLQGFPGAIHVPILKQLFSANDSTITQTDIVMLMTPHIIRTQGLTEKDFRPIYIGTPSNPALGGPPPLIAPTGDTNPSAPALQSPPTLAGGTPVGRPTPQGQPVIPPGSPIPGTVMQPPAQPQPAPVPAPPAAAQPSAPAAVPAPPPQPAPPAAAAPASPAPQPAALVAVTPPGAQFTVGGGPYVVPVSINNVNRLTTVSLTVTFNGSAVRVRTVQEGSFMRQGGAQVAFAQQVDPAAGRIDITLSRTGDTVGATGSGILASLIFEPVAAGTVVFAPSGVASGPAGSIALSFSPATVTVK
jgi:general secretion pathway protein D